MPIPKNYMASVIAVCGGLSKVAEQCLLTAAVQNMKKIARLFWRGTSNFFMLLLCFCKNTKPVSHLRWALSVI